MTTLRIVDLGTTSYRDAWDDQLARVERRKTGDGVDELLLVEHPHVITLGRRREAARNVLAAGDVPVVEIERGGDVTYHGPGQLVAYPIVLLRDTERDLHRFLRNLEEGLIRTLADLGISGERRAGATGVWVGERKIASIGIACRRWVTFHGVALNVSTDLAYFDRIRPCGFAPEVMTSVTNVLGREVSVEEAKSVVAKRLGEVLGRPWS